MTPWHVGSDYVHVNDPSITKHYNSAAQAWQYTMFYTACFLACNQNDNEILSSVSSDGIHWSYPQPLLNGANGPAEPSAVYEPQADGSVWKVYYVDRMEPTVVKMARVNGNRNATSIHTVYVNPTGNVISSADVRYINGKWQLFFNMFHSMASDPAKLDRVDLHKVESSSNEWWAQSDEVLIENSGPTVCATVTPHAVPSPIDPTRYELYFGMSTRMPSGECNLEGQTMHRWTWVD